MASSRNQSHTYERPVLGGNNPALNVYMWVEPVVLIEPVTARREAASDDQLCPIKIEPRKVFTQAIRVVG